VDLVVGNRCLAHRSLEGKRRESRNKVTCDGRREFDGQLQLGAEGRSVLGSMLGNFFNGFTGG